MAGRVGDRQILEDFMAGYSLETIMYFRRVTKERVDLVIRAAIPNGKK